MSAEDAWESLRSLVVDGKLSESSSMEEGGMLKLGNVTYDMKLMVTVSSQDGSKSISYSLGSLYLHLRDPELGFIKYRNACKDAGISDSMKVLDMKWIKGYFSGKADDNDDEEEEEEEGEPTTSQEAGKDDAMPMDVDSDKEEEERSTKNKSSTVKVQVESPGKQHKQHRRHHHHKKDKRSSSSRDKKSGSSSSSKGPITNEDLFANLETVVGKRSARQDSSSSHHAQDSKDAMSMTEESKQTTAGSSTVDGQSSSMSNKATAAATLEELQKRKIKDYLSSTGYEVTKLSKEKLEDDRPQVEKIMSNEIPVGNSASILRPTHHKRDFSQVLDLYQQVLKEEERKKRSPKSHHTSTDSHKRKRLDNQSNNNSNNNKRREDLGKPIIIVPNTMTSPITLVNAEEFLGHGRYVTRQEMLKRMAGTKRQQTVILKRNIASRLGGGLVEYEIIDNPKTRLARDRDWDRVVAVIGQGAAWQFKGWKYTNPVEIFSKTFGFYIGMEGAPVPKDITSWNVKREVLSRDKRGMDRITYASFWNSLDEWMSVHKPEYLPLEDV